MAYDATEIIPFSMPQAPEPGNWKLDAENGFPVHPPPEKVNLLALPT